MSELANTPTLFLSLLPNRKLRLLHVAKANALAFNFVRVRRPIRLTRTVFKLSNRRCVVLVLYRACVLLCEAWPQPRGEPIFFYYFLFFHESEKIKNAFAILVRCFSSFFFLAVQDPSFLPVSHRHHFISNELRDSKWERWRKDLSSASSTNHRASDTSAIRLHGNHATCTLQKSCDAMDAATVRM